MNRRHLIAIAASSLFGSRAVFATPVATPALSSEPLRLSIETDVQVSHFVMQSPGVHGVVAQVFSLTAADAGTALRLFEDVVAQRYAWIDRTGTDADEVLINAGQLGEGRYGWLNEARNRLDIFAYDAEYVTCLRLGSDVDGVDISDFYANEVYPAFLSIGPFNLVPTSFPVGWDVVQGPTESPEEIVFD